MKNPMGMLGIIGSILGAGMLTNPCGVNFSDEERAQRQRDLDESRTPETEYERAKRLGLKVWDFDGVVVYAATKKKALKLLNNLKK